MTEGRELSDVDRVPKESPYLLRNSIAWAWGRGFLVGAILIIIFYQGIVVWLASDKWRIVLMSFCMVPVYGWAHWIGARKGGSKNPE